MEAPSNLWIINMKDNYIVVWRSTMRSMTNLTGNIFKMYEGVNKIRKVLSFILLIAVSCVCLLSSETTFADEPVVQWEKTLGWLGADYGGFVKQTLDDGYIVAGTAWPQYAPGHCDFYLIKTDSYGTVQWQRTFGDEASEDWCHSVQQTSDGGYILAGTRYLYEAGQWDIDAYLVKTDASGNMQWQRTYGGADNDGAYSIHQTSDEGYIVAGETCSYGAGAYDVYLVKTDSSGNVQWQRAFGGTGSEWGNSVQLTLDGGYIVTGGGGVNLIKTDSSGNMQWQRTFGAFGGASYGGGRSIQQTLDSGYIIVGTTSSNGAGLDDVYLIKTDSSGNMQWERTFGGTSYDRGYSVHQTLSGEYIVTGWTMSYGAGSRDVYVIKTNSSGNMQWQKTFGGTSIDEGHSVQQTRDGGYIVAGEIESYDTDNFDAYLIKLGPEEQPSGPWSFVHITDPHIGGCPEDDPYKDEEELAATIDEIIQESPELILVTGDIAHYGCDSDFTCHEIYDRYLNAIQNAIDAGIKVYTIPGNHDRRTYPGDGEDYEICSLGCYYLDINKSVPSDALLFNELSSGNYYFVHKELLFVGLDTGSGFWREDVEGLTLSQIDALENLTSKYPNTAKVVFMHHPGFNSWYSINEEYQEDFQDWCYSNKVQLVLSGHQHQSHAVYINGEGNSYILWEWELPEWGTERPLYITTPSVTSCQTIPYIAHDPRGYRIIDVQGSMAYPQEYTEGEVRKKITASNYSPTNLHMYDSIGRHVGIIQNDEAERNIPHSFYFNHCIVNNGSKIFPEKIIVFEPQDDYLYLVVGKEQGTYCLELCYTDKDESEIKFTANNIPTSPGARHAYTVDWDAIAAGEEGIIVEIDADGDGIFERTITADEDLTAEEFALQTETVIDFEPDTFNLQSKGKFVTVYIELPQGSDLSNVDISSLKLNDTIPALSNPVGVGDYDGDGRPDLMVKFDRQQVIEILEPGTQMIVLSGQLYDETPIAGLDFIRVIGGESTEVVELDFEWIMTEEFIVNMVDNLQTTDEVDGEGKFEVREAVGFMLFEAGGIINELGPESFNNEESAFELSCAINDIFTMLDEGMYFEVVVMLQGDILERMDGCANTGQPNEDDWITSIEGQTLLYPRVVEIIELLKSML